MPPLYTLSVAEFASLAMIGSAPPLDVQMPSEHLLKLLGVRYIKAVHGKYEATTIGRIRIAIGS
jgi:hypothetical protein